MGGSTGNFATVLCDAGDQATGGGFNTGSDDSNINFSVPYFSGGQEGWQAALHASDAGLDIYVYCLDLGTAH
jgi:hypothetical protein